MVLDGGGLYVISWKSVKLKFAIVFVLQHYVSLAQISCQPLLRSKNGEEMLSP